MSTRLGPAPPAPRLRVCSICSATLRAQPWGWAVVQMKPQILGLTITPVSRPCRAILAQAPAPDGIQSPHVARLRGHERRRNAPAVEDGVVAPLPRAPAAQ